MRPSISSSGFGSEGKESDRSTKKLLTQSIIAQRKDIDKNAETKVFSKRLENSKRPSSILRSQSFGGEQETEARQNVPATVNIDDEVFAIDKGYINKRFAVDDKLENKNEKK